MNFKNTAIAVVATIATIAALAAFWSMIADEPRPQKEPLSVEAQPREFPPVIVAEPGSPFMWYQHFKNDKGKVIETRAGYRDNRLAFFLYNRTNGGLARVVIHHPGAEAPVAFDAQYDEAGSSIARWQRYRSDGSLEMTMVRDSNSETHTAYSSGGARQSQVETLADGSQKVKEFGLDGSVVRSSEVPAELREQVVAEWDLDGRKAPRLKLRLKGVRIEGWEYLDRAGKLEHTATFVSGGAIEFNYPEDGKDKPRRRQRYAAVAEDWVRVYYRLELGEVFYPDGKTVNHRVVMHANGMQKQHDRFDKDGRLEAVRNFSPQMIQLRMEEFDVATGKSKGVWSSPPLPASRGFVPDGIKNVPGWDEKAGPVYDFGGTPYMDHTAAQRTNPLFVMK